MANKLFEVTPVASQIYFDRLTTSNLTARNLEDAISELSQSQAIKNNYLSLETVERSYTISHNFQLLPEVQVLEVDPIGDFDEFDPFTYDAFPDAKYRVADQNKYTIEHVDLNTVIFSQEAYNPVRIILRG